MENFPSRLHSVFIDYLPESRLLSNVSGGLLTLAPGAREDPAFLPERPDLSFPASRKQTLPFFLRPGVLSVSRKGQRVSCDRTFKIDRRVVVILKLQILVGSAMAASSEASHIPQSWNGSASASPQAPPENHVIERGTQLAGASSDGIHRPAVLVGSGGRISVLNGKRRQQV